MIRVRRLKVRPERVRATTARAMRTVSGSQQLPIVASITGPPGPAGPDTQSVLNQFTSVESLVLIFENSLL